MSLHLTTPDAIGGLIECKRLVKCNANEWSVQMQSGGQVECNFAGAKLMKKSPPRWHGLLDGAKAAELTSCFSGFPAEKLAPSG